MEDKTWGGNPDPNWSTETFDNREFLTSSTPAREFGDGGIITAPAPVLGGSLLGAIAVAGLLYFGMKKK